MNIKLPFYNEPNIEDRLYLQKNPKHLIKTKRMQYVLCGSFFLFILLRCAADFSKFYKLKGCTSASLNE